MTGALMIVLLAAPSIVDAERVEGLLAKARLAHDTRAEHRALLEAARLPWPLLANETEALIAEHRRELDDATRRSWALDRALPILAGALSESDTVLKDVLSEVASAVGAAGRPSDMQQLAAARSAYAARQLAQAEARYSAVTQGSPLWPDALRERAWTLLVLGRPDDSLGATVALGAPYFAPEDQAEGRLLRATVLLSRCRFDEARQVVAALANAAVPKLDAAEASQAIALDKPPVDPVGVRAWGAPLVRRVRVALDAELPASAAPAVTGRRKELVELGARLLQAAFVAEAEEVRQTKERALQVMYESYRSERTLLEQGIAPSAPVAATPALLDDDDVAWKFDGTYWRDELNSYRYSAGDACHRSDPR